MTVPLVCTRCGQTYRPAEAKTKSRQCRACRRAVIAECQRKNPEIDRRAHAKWVSRPENAQHRRDYTKEYRTRMPEEVRERERERARAAYRANPLRFKQANARRRAREQWAGGSFTQEQWETLCARHGHCCLACGETKPLTPDHVLPVVNGGSGDITNIQPLCLACNMKKHKKHIDYRPKEEADVPKSEASPSMD